MKKTLLTLTMFAATIFIVNSQNILTEDFESGALPTGWSRTQNSPSVGWEFGTTTALGSQYWAIPSHTKAAASNDDKHDNSTTTANLADLDFLITPAMDFTPYTAVFLQFEAYFSGAYSSTAHIKVSTDGGTTWTNVLDLTPQSTWQAVSVNLSAYVSSSTVQVAFHHNDNAAWASGFAIDDVVVLVPNNIDMAGVSMSMENYVMNAAQTVSGVLNNQGASTITSMDLNYNVDNGTVVTQSLSSLNIAALANYSFSHGTPWVPASTGNHTIKVWTSNINGSVDQNIPNDTVTKTLYVADTLSQRKVLYEQFTSNTCGPCASSAPAITTFLNNNSVNQASGKVVALKYHMDYPSPGNDAAYTLESDSRHTYYGVGGIPYAAIDGNAYNGHPGNTTTTQTVVDAEYARPGIFNISMTASYLGNVVSITGDYTSHVDISGSLKLHVVVIENNVLKSQMNGTGTTSQTEFKQVMRKMLPNATGTTVATQTAGQNTAFTFSHDFTTTPQIFNGMNQLTAIAFIQNNITKEVYQAEAVPVTINDVGIDEANSSVFGVSVYPNPVTNNANLVFGLKEAGNVQVAVLNMIGEVVHSQIADLPAGEQSILLNVNELPSGMYFVNLKTGNNTVTKKINIVK